MFDSVKSAISDLEEGKMVILVDEDATDNIGRFVIAAEMITSEDVNFMSIYGRGVISAPLSPTWATRLELTSVVEDETKPAFTVSIDASTDISSGISARDRAVSLSKLSSPICRPEDFVKPGHIFPIITHTEGVLQKAQHSEAAVDLAKLAGFNPVGVTCQVLGPCGNCATLEELRGIAQIFDLRLITIASLTQHLQDPQAPTQRPAAPLAEDKITLA